MDDGLFEPNLSYRFLTMSHAFEVSNLSFIIIIKKRSSLSLNCLEVKCDELSLDPCSRTYMSSPGLRTNNDLSFMVFQLHWECTAK